VLIFDPSEMSDYLDVADPVTVGELERRPSILAAEQVRLVVCSMARDEAELGAEVERVAQVARAARDLLLIWEEVGDYCDPQQPCPGAPFCLSKLARNGRKQGLPCVWISQCAVEIPLKVRRQATRIVSFGQSEVLDVTALEARCGEPFAAQVRAWRKGEPPAIWTLPSLEA
jgi:hypothetical protein